ncbi:MAG: hypothetical protein NHB32_12385 [Fischerella sp. CENA71]|nr:hypothetical protein [Fischerella sp. CENA71]
MTHVVFGCDDELKLLPLTFIVSDYKFRDYLRDRQHPAVEVMYNDLVERQGLLWLYSSILAVLPRLLPELVLIWIKNRSRKQYWPYFDYKALFECSLLEIRRKFDILQD